MRLLWWVIVWPGLSMHHQCNNTDTQLKAMHRLWRVLIAEEKTSGVGNISNRCNNYWNYKHEKLLLDLLIVIQKSSRGATPSGGLQCRVIGSPSSTIMGSIPSFGNLGTPDQKTENKQKWKWKKKDTLACCFWKALVRNSIEQLSFLCEGYLLGAFSSISSVMAVPCLLEA